MKIAVLGGGFGLYGYVPAIIHSQHQVVTLKKYQESFKVRNELVALANMVQFVESDQEALNSSDALVIARSPARQTLFIKENFEELSKLKNLFLEKPLAPSVSEHAEILELLGSGKIPFTLGYIFRYTPWFTLVLEALGQNQRLEIKWKFRQSLGSWKQSTESGGGITAFLTSHFVDLFNEVGASLTDLSIEINTPSEQIFNFEVGRSLLRLEITTGETDSFEINIGDRTVFNSQTPLGPRGAMGSIDPRVSLLSKYIDSVIDGTHLPNSLAVEKQVIELREKFLM